MKRFWNWVRDQNDPNERTLRLEGAIAEESWFDDEITPKAFRDELFDGDGPITIWINSPGGDCVAAAQIYNMLMDYPHDVTVRVDGIAASAASVIAMAGTRVIMTPVSLMMIHNPLTVAMGDSEEMRKAIQLLDEVKESIINAYQIKTGLSRAKLSHLMDSETWMNAVKAKELGFCDEILYTGDHDLPDEVSGFSYGRKAAAACLMNRVIATLPKAPMTVPAEPEHPPNVNSVPAPNPETPVPDNRVKAADLEKRLSLLK